MTKNNQKSVVSEKEIIHSVRKMRRYIYIRLKGKRCRSTVFKNSQSFRRNRVADAAARTRKSNEETSVLSERTRTIVHLWWKRRESGNRSDGAMWLHD